MPYKLGDAEDYFQRYLDQCALPGALNRDLFLAQLTRPGLRNEVRRLILQNEEIVHAWCGRDKSPEPSIWRNGSVVFGHFKLKIKLGSGSASVVWQAYDQSLNRLVALKVLRGILFDARVIDRLKLEARVLASIDFPGVVRLFDTVQDEECLALVTECVGTGETLKTLLSGPSPWRDFNVQERVRLLLLPLEGLANAHRQGILHRDIKPANLLWSGSKLKLSDFGLAASLDEMSGATLTGEFIGTHAYAAPEQHEGRRVHACADVFSFGATIYESLLQERLFLGGTPGQIRACILSGQRKWPASFEKLPRDLQAILIHALQHRPQDRYADATSFASDLTAWLERRPIVARLPSTLEKARLWICRNPLPSSVAAVLVLGLVLSTFFAFKASKAEMNALHALQIAQGLIRTMDPLLPITDRGSRQALLEELSQALASNNSLPTDVRANLWTTVGEGLMGVGVYDEARTAFEQAVSMSPALMNEVKLAWCLLEVSHSLGSCSKAGQEHIQEAINKVTPIAAMPWSGNDSEDFVIALARNRLSTIRIFQTNPTFPQDVLEKDFRAQAKSYEKRPGFEPWLAPMNLVDLGVCLDQQGKWKEALSVFQEAEQSFRDADLASHNEMVYALAGQAQIYFRLNQTHEAAAAFAAVIQFYQEHGKGYTKEALVFQIELAKSLRTLERAAEAQSVISEVIRRIQDPRFEGNTSSLQLSLDVYETGI